MADQRLMRVNKGLVKLLVILMFVNLGGLGAAFFTAHDGRTNLRDSNRTQCEQRSKKAAEAQADFAAGVLSAFRETDKKIPGPNTKTRNDAEKRIDKVRKSAIERSMINCEEAYP